MRHWDYIIVGGGSAGAAAAARLSENPLVTVLLVEAGGSGKSPFIQVPNGVYFVKGLPRYHWLMEVEPDPTRNNRVETLTCGRGLGGGSSINGMVFVKGLKTDFDTWEKTAGIEWSATAVDRAYKRMDTTLKVEAPSTLHPISQLFLESAKTFGLPDNTTDLLKTTVGVMPCPTNASRGFRQSTERAYLRPARKRKNLTVITQSTALRVIIEDSRAKGIIVERNGQQEKFYANKEVILSAGAINTPHILMMSGIGPEDHLKSVGIKPILDLPSVGKGLQDHPCIWMSLRVKPKTWTDALNLKGIIKTGMEWLCRRSGPAASGMIQITLYGSTKGDCDIPDYQASFMPAGYVVLDDGVEFLSYSSVTTAVSLCRPIGRGSIRLRSSNPNAKPIINYRLLDNSSDLEILRNACRDIRAIYSTAPMSDNALEEVAPGETVQDDEDWENYLRRFSVNMCHPVGSCRMGLDKESVVDPHLKVRGITNLRIADASIMPQITSGNTNAPSIMIGERVAEFIQKESS